MVTEIIERGIFIDSSDVITYMPQPKDKPKTYRELHPLKPNTGLRIGSYNSKSKNKVK